MEWVTARELIVAMGDDPRSPSDAVVRRICKRAYAEVLRTRAAIFMRDGSRFNDFELPFEFWWAEGAASLQPDWEGGDFLSGRPDGHRWSAFGVLFNKDDADLMEGCHFDQSALDAAAPASKGGGAPAKIKEWHEFWLEAVRLADRGELRSFESQAELRRSLLLAIGDRLSEPSVLPQVRQIWHKIIDQGDG